MDKQRILALCNHILGETGKIAIVASESNVAHFREIQIAAHMIEDEVKKPEKPNPKMKQKEASEADGG